MVPLAMTVGFVMGWYVVRTLLSWTSVTHLRPLLDNVVILNALCWSRYALTSKTRLDLSR